MAVAWVYVALASYNTGRLTLGLGCVECLVDGAAHVAVVDGKGRIVRGRGHGREGSAGKSGGGGGGGGGAGAGAGVTGAAGERLVWRNLWNEGTDAVMDVPLGGVCEILYGEGRDEDDDDFDDV